MNVMERNSAFTVMEEEEKNKKENTVNMNLRVNKKLMETENKCIHWLIEKEGCHGGKYRQW